MRMWLILVISCVSDKLPLLWFQTAPGAANALARIANWVDLTCIAETKMYYLLCYCFCCCCCWRYCCFQHFQSEQYHSERWHTQNMTRKAGWLLLLMLIFGPATSYWIESWKIDIKHTVTRNVVVFSPDGLSVRGYLTVKDDWTGRWHSK